MKTNMKLVTSIVCKNIVKYFVTVALLFYKLSNEAKENPWLIS